MIKKMKRPIFKIRDIMKKTKKDEGKEEGHGGGGGSSSRACLNILNMKKERLECDSRFLMASATGFPQSSTLLVQCRLTGKSRTNMCCAGEGAVPYLVMFGFVGPRVRTVIGEEILRLRLMEEGTCQRLGLAVPRPTSSCIPHSSSIVTHASMGKAISRPLIMRCSSRGFPKEGFSTQASEGWSKKGVNGKGS